MERVGDRQGKMERYCSTGQSPQRAVAPTEKEKDQLYYNLAACLLSHLTYHSSQVTTALILAWLLLAVWLVAVWSFETFHADTSEVVSCLGI